MKKYKYKIVDVDDGSFGYLRFFEDLFIAICVKEHLNREFGNRYKIVDITEEVSNERIL